MWHAGSRSDDRELLSLRSGPRPPLLPRGFPRWRLRKSGTQSRQRLDRLAASRYPAGSGLPALTSSAVTITAGSGIPAAAIRRNARACRRRGDDGPSMGWASDFEKRPQPQAPRRCLRHPRFPLRAINAACSLGIHPGQRQAIDGVDGASAMDGGQEGLDIDPLASGPGRPDPLGGGDGVEDGAVHVEQKSAICGC